MGKFHILVFIVSTAIVIYIIVKRLQQKDKEKHLNDKNRNEE